MASLKRDTPAGRAALARRRQRAAAVVENPTRFHEEASVEDERENQQRTLMNESQQQQQQHSYVQQQQQQQQQQEASRRQPLRGRTSQQDPPPQVPKQEQYSHKQQQQQQKPKDTNPKVGRSSTTTSYSTASLPTSDELLQRSSQVAQAAASVLESARKSRRPQKSYVYNTSANVNDRYAEQSNLTSPFQQTSFHQQPSITREPKQQQLYSTPLTAYQKGDTTGNKKQPSFPEKYPLPKQRQHEPDEQQQQYRDNVQRTELDSNEELQPQQSYQRDREPSQQISGIQEPMSDEDDSESEEDYRNISDDYVTGEEREPLLLSPQDETLDAACITSGSWVMLRSMATAATVTADEKNDDDYGSLAQVHGAGLGMPEELIQIVKLQIANTVASEEDGSALRWGDTVAVLSPIRLHHQQPMALGIREHDNHQFTKSSMRYEVGWFQSTLGQNETWTILRPSQNLGVRVGLEAFQATKLLAEARAAKGECTTAVQWGDPILLRNCQTGGILTVDGAAGQLKLVTDSYDSNNVSPQNINTTLLEQLQQHERYYPTVQDAFALVKSSVPPCPNWVLGGGTGSSNNQTSNPTCHRMFLHRTYLTESERNDFDSSLQDKLFGKQWASSGRMQQQPEGSHAPMSLADQETILLDEVIGACMGLDGQYVKIIPRRQESSSGYVRSVQGLEFALQNGSHQVFDVSLRNLVERILPLATSYAHVSAFVAAHLPGYEFGSVMQALCEVLDMLLEEYATFMGEIEQQFRCPKGIHQSLTLRKLYTHVLSSLHIMSVLEKATISVGDKTGGALINALSMLKAWSCEGDLIANKVLAILLDKASVPYMTMLASWLQDGLLRDPYGEFMVEICDHKQEDQPSEMKHAADSRFNDESYLIREEHILSGLVSTEAMLQKVVSTGKYWRAVRACEVLAVRNIGGSMSGKRERNHCKDWNQKTVPVLRYGLDFSNTSSFIQAMYEQASEALMSLLMKDFNFLRALRTMKQYFLLDHGDFLVHFLDSAEDELLKELGDVSSGRVQHWLRMSVQLTEDNATKGRQEAQPQQQCLSPLALRCRFQPVSLIDHVKSLHLMRGRSTAGLDAETSRHDESFVDTPSRETYGLSNKGLTGVETFMLDFPSVPFPISLVLSDAALGNYQLLFRLLFFAKYVERRLVKIWQDHQAMKELNSVRGLFGPTFLLRQRMLHFAQNLIYYIMFEVVEPNWLEMEDAMGNPVGESRRTVDDIVDIHDAFLYKTLAACLLTDKDLVRTLTKLMTTCLMFADQMKLFTEATRIHDESTNIAAERRSAIQRSLNDRGSGGRGPVDKQALREAINAFKQESHARVKKQKKRVGRELSSESYRRMVTRFDEVFSAYLSEFMVQLNSDAGAMYGSHKSNLCIRLDYNGFLSSSIVIDDGRLA